MSPLPTPTPASTPNYSGIASPPASSGTLQTAGWDAVPQPANWMNVASEVLQAVPACVRVQLATGAGLTRIGPNQYQATVSLSGAGTLQLVPNAADASQNPTVAVAPNVFSFTYLSRNRNVCTVNTSGLVTAVGRGECEILISSTRSVNASFAGAAPSGTEGVQASLQVVVVP